jgi:outer membrane receptor for ferrienterochelin and colicin
VSNTSKFPEITTTIYPPNLSNNDTTHLNTSSFRIEGYVQQTWQISDRMFFSSGLRFDYFDLNKGAKVSPRTSLTYKASDNLTLRAAWGIFFQPPSFNQLKSSIASEHNTNFQKAFHYILGAEKYFSNDVSLKLEGYYKSYSELIPVNRRSDGVLSYPSKENNSEGYAAGFDFQFTVNFGNINFWLSYGYLVAREKSLIDNLGYFPRYTDQTHTLSAVSSYDIGSGWSINLRAFCGSGFAYTPSNIVYDSKSFIYKWISASKNSGHFPSYERVDVRITKEIDVFGKPLQIYIDAMNVFGRKNVISIRYAYDEIGLPKVVENLLYGLIPTLGISYSF